MVYKAKRTLANQMKILVGILIFGLLLVAGLLTAAIVWSWGKGTVDVYIHDMYVVVATPHLLIVLVVVLALVAVLARILFK